MILGNEPVQFSTRAAVSICKSARTSCRLANYQAVPLIPLVVLASPNLSSPVKGRHWSSGLAEGHRGGGTRQPMGSRLRLSPDSIVSLNAAYLI